jgi:WG containing repeat
MRTFAQICLFIVVVAVTGLSAIAQQLGDELKVSCAGVFGLCGFVDADGLLVIPRRYEAVRRFSNQLAAARENGRWGYISTEGKFAIEPRFELVSDFRNDRAEVIVKNRAGIIDKDGSFTVRPRFWRAVPLGRDAALVVDRRRTKTQHRRLDLDSLYDYFRLYHSDLGVVPGAPTKFSWFVRPGDRGPSDRIWASNDGRIFGLLDNRGNWLVEPRFHHVQSLHENRAIVAERDPSGDKKWGAVDGDGQIAIPLEHDWLGYFSNGYGLVGGKGAPLEREVGLIRKNGTIVGKRLFEKADRPSLNRPARVRDKGIWYTITEDGTLTRDEPDGTLVASCPQGLRVLRDGPGYLATNEAGESAVDIRIDSIAFGISKNGSVNGGAIYRRELDCGAPIAFGRGRLNESEWTYIKPDGELLMTDTWFSSTYRFVDGFAVVGTETRSKENKNSLWGILDETGAYTLPLGPDRIERTRHLTTTDGSPIFYRGDADNFETIDPWGNSVEPSKATQDTERARALQCPAGAKIVADGEFFGIEDPEGSTLVPSIHRAISCFHNGVAWAPDVKKQKWCPVGPDGKFRDQPNCIDDYYPFYVSHHFPEKFADERFESNIRWVNAWLKWGLDQREDPPEWVGDGVMSKVSYSVRPFRMP